MIIPNINVKHLFNSLVYPTEVVRALASALFMMDLRKSINRSELLYLLNSAYKHPDGERCQGGRSKVQNRKPRHR